MKPADTILDAVDCHRQIGLLSDDGPSLDDDGAYAMAWAFHARRLERGERPVGCKIGFTNRAIWGNSQPERPFSVDSMPRLSDFPRSSVSSPQRQRQRIGTPAR